MVLKTIRLVNQGSHIRSRVSSVIRIETINRGPMTIFQDKLLTRTYRIGVLHRSQLYLGHVGMHMGEVSF